MRGQKKKIQRKWENSEDYNKSKKEKEYLTKYKNIAGEYLEDWEFIELLKKNNFDDEQISKELNKIILGDEFKWKEIKNGKPVTTRSTDQIRKKKNYYLPEKSYPSYDKTKPKEESNDSKNKKKQKGSFHKYYVTKRPKRPFQKCIEVPSDYQPPNNDKDNKKENKNIEDNKNNKEINNNNIEENSEKENLRPKNNDNFDGNNKINIKKNMGMNIKEETKNDIKNSSEEEKRKLLLKGKAFNSLKRIKNNNTDIKNKENINNIQMYNRKENNEKNSNAPGPEINLTQDLNTKKELQKKYFRDLVGYMRHYPKKIENNIKRATSKDSETSDDRSPETIKRRKIKNIPTSSTIFQKKKMINNSNNNEINRNLRKTYDIEQNEIEFESKVANISINSCYDNPYRDQYLKIINEKR